MPIVGESFNFCMFCEKLPHPFFPSDKLKHVWQQAQKKHVRAFSSHLHRTLCVCVHVTTKTHSCKDDQDVSQGAIPATNACHNVASRGGHRHRPARHHSRPSRASRQRLVDWLVRPTTLVVALPIHCAIHHQPIPSSGAANGWSRSATPGGFATDDDLALQPLGMDLSSRSCVEEGEEQLR